MSRYSTPEHPADGSTYRRDLGQGLLLRWSTSEDVDNLADMFANVMRATADAPADAFHDRWVRMLMSGRHPHCSPEDFALVEDTSTGQIVASANLFANQVTYEHIPFTLGRAAIVGTAVGYRHRGLQRAVFDLLHARSAARGHLAQGITGIHYFYRQFGYEYAIDLEASRHLYIAALPRTPATGATPFALRPAQEADVPQLLQLAAHERARWQVATVLDEQAWRWMLGASDPTALGIRIPYMITTGHNAIIGYLLVDRIRGGDSLSIWGLAVIPGVSLAAEAPQILHAAYDLAKAIPVYSDQELPLLRFRLEMGPGHALFDALGAYMAPPCKYPYAWWMRIPDAPAFIRHIAPVLDYRLAHSAMSGFSGELAITFYRGGLRITFDRGKLSTAEAWEAPLWEEGQAGFPPGLFAQLLLGYHSFADLRHIYKDVWAEGINRTLLETLFPPRYSYMLPLF